jgi:hypothetical protein
MILSSGDLARPGLSAARRGHTPVITVSGKGSGRVSVAGLVCLRPDTRGHLFYRVRIHHGRKGERRSMSEADYAGLIAGVTPLKLQSPAAVCALLQTRADYVTRSGPSHVSEPIADYFALSVPRFAARAWLQVNLLCVLGEVISEREADLVHGV